MTPNAPTAPHDGAPIGISPFPDTPAPSLAPPQNVSFFVDDLPDSASPSEQHAWLESHGFVPDDSMLSYSHSLTSCPTCDSSGHVLFGRWGEDSAAPSYFCQKLQKHLDWTPSAVALPAPESAGALPTEEEAATPPPEGPATWTAVTSIAELKALPRWIGVKNKKPLQYRPNSDPTKPLKGSTFSHRGKDDSKCGGFVDDISAQSFVRHGGVCLDHVSVSEQWDAKESRFRRMKRITPELQSMGWGTYAKWETLLEGKSGGYGISYCCTYNDAPKIIVVDIDFPKAKKGEELDPVVVEAADATRDAITQRLSALGCPTCRSRFHQGPEGCVHGVRPSLLPKQAPDMAAPDRCQCRAEPSWVCQTRHAVHAGRRPARVGPRSRGRPAD